MSIPTEVIEAAARALFAVENCDRRQMLDVESNWRGRLNDANREEYRILATAALTAAAPHIQAAALAPILALHKPVEISYFDGEDDEFSATCCDHCTISQDDDSLVRWPCATARAATIEGKSA